MHRARSCKPATVAFVTTLCAVVLLLWALPVRPAYENHLSGYRKGQLLLLVAQHLHNVAPPAVLEYDFRQYRAAGDCTRPHRTAHTVTVTVTASPRDGRRNVVVDFLDKNDAQAVTAVSGTYANPLITVFLQRDVDAMAQTVAATADYFRHVIRQALADHASSEAIEILHAGRKLPASKIVLHPFADKANAHINAVYRDKYYEFVIAAAVPGGVYSIRTLRLFDWCSMLTFRRVQ